MLPVSTFESSQGDSPPSSNHRTSARMDKLFNLLSEGLDEQMPLHASSQQPRHNEPVSQFVSGSESAKRGDGSSSQL